MWYSETLSYLHTTNLVVIAAYAALIIFLFLVIVKLYTWMTTGVYRGTTSMKGKVVIITGCNSGNEIHFYTYNMVGHGAHKCIYYNCVSISFSFSGIGKETAKDVAKRGARVIMACRNMETGSKARGKNKNRSLTIIIK